MGREVNRMTSMESSPRPVIAIDGELALQKTSTITLPTRYAEAVHRSGGLPLVLPPISSDGYPAELLSRIDGLLLSGGDDFDTEALGLGPVHPAAKPVPGEKQAFDLELVAGALSLGLPVLGVCFGMQLMALADGAGLHQHLPTDRPDAAGHSGGVRHPVRIEAGSKLHELFGVPQIDVISRHHQALSSVGPRWTVTGTDPEGLIEAVEHREHPFAPRRSVAP